MSAWEREHGELPTPTFVPVGFNHLAGTFVFWDRQLSDTAPLGEVVLTSCADSCLRIRADLAKAGPLWQRFGFAVPKRGRLWLGYGLSDPRVE